MSEAGSEEPLLEPAPEPQPTATPVPSRGEIWARRGGWIVIVLCVLIAYANSFRAPFIFDGANYLKEADTIRTLWPPSVLYQELKDLGVMTRAVVYVTFAVDYLVYGYDVGGWHATSVLIHIIAALALYGIARHGFASPRAHKYFGPVAERAALAVALIWGVHPLNTQSVTYLYQRQESLMGMFYLLTLYLMTRLAKPGKLPWGLVWRLLREQQWGQLWSVLSGLLSGLLLALLMSLLWGVLSIVACGLGMASKEVMITAPLVVFWYDAVFCRKSWLELILRRGWYYVGLAATWGVLYWAMSQIGQLTYSQAGILDEGRITRYEYAATQPGVILRYLKLSLLPTDLNIDYAWKKALEWPLDPNTKEMTPFPDNVYWGPILRPAAVIGGLALLSLIAMFRTPALGFLGGSFFVILSPSSSVAPIIDLCFEHRMYLSLAPLVALLVVCVHRLFQTVAARRPTVTPVLGAAECVALWLVIAALITLTLLRNNDYRSELALWGDAVRKAPKNHRAHYNYGVYLQIDGQFDPAIQQYQEALQYDPNYSDAYLNLGNLALFSNQLEPAERYYQELLRRIPDHVDGLYGMADIYKRRGDPAWARYYLDQLLMSHPDHAEGKAMLAEVQVALDRLSASQRPSGTAPLPLPAATP